MTLTPETHRHLRYLWAPFLAEVRQALYQESNLFKILRRTEMLHHPKYMAASVGNVRYPTNMQSQTGLTAPTAAIPAAPVVRRWKSKNGLEIDITEKPGWTKIVYPTSVYVREFVNGFYKDTIVMVANINDYMEKIAQDIQNRNVLPVFNLSSHDFHALFGPSVATAVLMNGCICKRCNMKNEYAEPNQKDGTYVCYACR